MSNAAALNPPDRGGRRFVAARKPASLARVTVYRRFADAAEAWTALEGVAAHSPYQSRRWLEAWHEATGQHAGVEPYIVVAADGEGRPSALLPFGSWRQGPLVVAGFLGGRDSNFNLGLFRDPASWSPAHLRQLLRNAAHAGRERIDLFVLRHQPHGWDGHANPFAGLPGQASPSFGHRARLQRDPEAFLKATLSKDARKKLRRKTEKLAELGPVEHVVADTPEQARDIISAFAAQRRARCAALGLGTGDLPALLDFLSKASRAESRDATVELHGLKCGDRYVATFAGTGSHDRHCGMVISFDASPEVSRFSPGDLLLTAILRQKCLAGVSVFDLGIGEARYKDTFCPEEEPLFDVVLAASLRGRSVALAETLRLRAKRSIKQSDLIWPLVKAARRSLAGWRRPTLAD